MKTATIKDVMFESKWNDFNIYKLSLDNGQSGSIFTKTWEPKTGEEFNYTYDVEKSRFKRVNPNSNYSGGGGGYKPSNSGGGSKDKLIVRQVALKAAVEYSAGMNLKANQVLQVADIFNEWVNQQPKPEEATPPPAQVREQLSAPTTDDDLPF
jgi:single-stranded DNA-binding protein